MSPPLLLQAGTLLFLSQCSFFTAQVVEGLQPGIFGCLRSCWYIRQGILQSVAFVFGIANVVIDHQVDPGQARIAFRECRDARQMIGRIVDARDERTAQPDTGTLP